jgi:hypothetical protein
VLFFFEIQDYVDTRFELLPIESVLFMM